MWSCRTPMIICILKDIIFQKITRSASAINDALPVVVVVWFLTVKSGLSQFVNMSFVFRSMSAEIREWAREVLASFRPHADLSLATVIHSLSCPFSSSKPSFLGTYVSVSYGLLRSPYWSCRRTPCAKHSPRRSWLFHCTEFGAIGIFAFPSTCPSWVSLQPFL
jgi:hypothetical protein